jgi:uroporphyrinogen-III decarboxylase
MNDRERFVNTLTGRPVDRVPFMKIFGGTGSVLPGWESEHPGLSDEIDELLKFEGTYRGWATTPVNFWMSQRGAPVVVEEDETRIVQRYPDGMVEELRKGKDFHHQTIEWPIKTRADWERYRAAYLQADDPSRFPDNWPELVEEYKHRTHPLQLTHGGVYGFARTLMGDEALLFAVYDDPGLVHEMMDVYTDMILSIWTRMVKDVDFDLVEFWEDMASKNGCLISPKTFREFMTPNYLRVVEFAREHGVEVILVDSDGYIDDLAEVMMESGVTAMYPFEIGAGCDLPEVRRRYPTMGIVGGLAKECMIEGPKTIDLEIEKVRDHIKLGRMIPGPDHFVLSNVSWENYRYFMERLREVVMTTAPEV